MLGKIIFQCTWSWVSVIPQYEFPEMLSIIKSLCKNWKRPYNFQIVISTLFLMLLFKIGCYIAIFRHSLIHEKSISTLLLKGQIRKGIRKNAFDLNLVGTLRLISQV